MLKQSFLATLLLTAVAAADVTLVSAFPQEVSVRVGERAENLEPRQHLTVPVPAAPLEVSADGKTLYKAQVTDGHVWVLHPQGALDAGLVQAQGTPRSAVGFFNSLPYTIVLHLTAEKVEPLEPIRIPSMRPSPPLDLPSEAFFIDLRDEVGNPIGSCWSVAHPGHYYLVWRKKPALYDLDLLGTMPAGKP